MKKFFSFLLILMLVFSALSFAYAQPQYGALFINVGKADAALLFLNGSLVLVDTGTKDSHEQLLRVLQTYQATELDAIIVTHNDKDHAGGLKKLLKAGVSADVIYAGEKHSEENPDDLRASEAAEKYDTAISWLKAGDVLEMGGCRMEILGPLSLDLTNENNNSLVIRLITPEGDMLLAGDMEEPEEEELMQAGLITPVDVLKVAHHGEGDSTSRRFLYLTRPEWAVISTNTIEEPDTPDAKVLQLLQEMVPGIAQTQHAEVGILITLADGNAQAQQIDWQ